MRRLGKLAATAAAAAVMTVGFALPASADTGKTTSKKAELGTSSLAALLAKDGSGFDWNWFGFDITDNAVAAVFKAKPTSPVAVLADGKTPVTAFLPTDLAFRNLAQSLTGHRYKSERKVFTVLASKLGIDTIESVLLYHVVPGATIDYRGALKADGAVLKTALPGSTVKVKVYYGLFVSLKDADPNDRNPFVLLPNLNRGNRQIAHGITTCCGRSTCPDRRAGALPPAAASRRLRPVTASRGRRMAWSAQLSPDSPQMPQTRPPAPSWRVWGESGDIQRRSSRRTDRSHRPLRDRPRALRSAPGDGLTGRLVGARPAARTGIAW